MDIRMELWDKCMQLSKKVDDLKVPMQNECQFTEEEITLYGVECVEVLGQLCKLQQNVIQYMKKNVKQ